MPKNQKQGCGGFHFHLPVMGFYVPVWNLAPTYPMQFFIFNYCSSLMCLGSAWPPWESSWEELFVGQGTWSIVFWLPLRPSWPPLVGSRTGHRRLSTGTYPAVCRRAPRLCCQSCWRLRPRRQTWCARGPPGTPRWNQYHYPPLKALCPSGVLMRFPLRFWVDSSRDLISCRFVRAAALTTKYCPNRPGTLGSSRNRDWSFWYFSTL